MHLRRLLMFALAATVGCQTDAMNRPAESESASALVASAPANPDIVPCAATVPVSAPETAASAAPEQEPAKTLPPPRKADEPIGACVVPPPGDGQQPLTLADLEQMALSSNPTIPQAAALVQQQQGLTRQVGLYPNPQAGYLRTDADQSGQSQTAGVFLAQTFVTAGKLRLARQAGRQDVQMRQWQLIAQQGRVLNDLRIRYYEVLGGQRAVEAAKELVNLAEDGVRTAEELLKARQGSRPDLLQAKIQLAALRTSLQNAEYRHRAAWRQMANVVGVSDLPMVPLIGSLEDDIPNLNWNESLQRLLSASPLLKTQEAEIRAAEIEVKAAIAQAIPDVSVQVVAQRDHVMKFSSVSTLIAMPVPLFNRNQGNIVNARGVLQQAQKEYERIRLALSDELTASFRQYETLRAQAEGLGKEIVPQAKENLDLTTQAYKAGRLDFLHVLNARQTYFQTRMARLDALTELHKVVAEIQGLQLIGGLNPTEVGTALQTTPGVTTGVRGVILQQLEQQQKTSLRNLPGVIQGAER